MKTSRHAPSATLARRGVLVGVAALAVACATVGGIKQEQRAAGRARTFEARLDRVTAATKKTLLDLGYVLEDTEQESDGAWMFVAGKRASATSWSNTIRVIVESTGPDAATVRVLTEKKMAANISAEDDLSQPIFSNIAIELRDTEPVSPTAPPPASP